MWFAEPNKSISKNQSRSIATQLLGEYWIVVPNASALAVPAKIRITSLFRFSRVFHTLVARLATYFVVIVNSTIQLAPVAWYKRISHGIMKSLDNKRICRLAIWQFALVSDVHRVPYEYYEWSVYECTRGKHAMYTAARFARVLWFARKLRNTGGHGKFLLSDRSCTRDSLERQIRYVRRINLTWSASSRLCLVIISRSVAFVSSKRF